MSQLQVRGKDARCVGEMMYAIRHASPRQENASTVTLSQAHSSHAPVFVVVAVPVRASGRGSIFSREGCRSVAQGTSNLPYMGPLVLPGGLFSCHGAATASNILSVSNMALYRCGWRRPFLSCCSCRRQVRLRQWRRAVESSWCLIMCPCSLQTIFRITLLHRNSGCRARTVRVQPQDLWFHSAQLSTGLRLVPNACLNCSSIAGCSPPSATSRGGWHAPNAHRAASVADPSYAASFCLRVPDLAASPHVLQRLLWLF